MINIYICVGSACHLKGSWEVIEGLKNIIMNNNLQDKITLKGSFCLEHCTEAVSVKLDNKVFSVNPKNIHEFFEKEVLRRIR